MLYEQFSIKTFLLFEQKISNLYYLKKEKKPKMKEKIKTNFFKIKLKGKITK